MVVPARPYALTATPDAETELARLARGRRLLLDWFAARCCSGVGVGDAELRWVEPDAVPPDAVRLPGIAGVETYARSELLPLLEAAGARIELSGRGPFRRPIVAVAEGAAWLDFFAARGGRAPRPGR